MKTEEASSEKVAGSGPNGTANRIPLLSGLNPQQREVALHGEGPLLVLAVAGSGKTRAIAHRAAYLMEEKAVASSEILCLTFTNKAVEEMRERIERLTGGRHSGMTIATFHALCARVLRAHHALIPRSSRFGIYDEEETAKLAQEVAKGLDAEGCWEALRRDIDQLKNRRVLPERNPEPDRNEEAKSDYRRLLLKAYPLYEDLLARYDAVDFTDLLLKTLLLLEQHPEVLSHLQGQHRYILVDEYQDTCPLQERLLQLLSAPANNLCVVGDDDQAIYTFRHADLQGILSFESRYSGAKVIRMEENYRSTGPIIDVARKVISVNTHRRPKAIRTENPEGPPVEVIGFPWEDQEALWICRMIQELQAEGIPLCEIALLCRVASLFRPIEKELTSALIPYVLVDSLAFWERREVKDVMAYLRLIHNPLDYLSFKRIANVPPRKLGKKTFEQIERSLKASPELSLVEILESLRRETPALRWFLNEIDVLRNQQGKISGLIETVLGRMGYEAYLVKNFPDAERRIGNLMQLLAIAKRFDRESNDLSEFLLQASLSGNGSEGDGGSPEGVKLMTIHAAKGLEFRAVFVIGLEEGILPHARCRANLEEERRLLYVAVTRAKERLILTWCDRRMIHGKEIGNRLSSFVKDLLPRGPGRWLGRENPGIRVRYSPAARCDQSGLLKERTSHESVPQQGQ